MHWMLSIFTGILAAVVACFGAGFVASLCVRWYRISSFEGGSGYYVVFLALLGGIAGLIAGIVCSRIVASQPDPTFLKALGFAVASVMVLLLLAGILARLGADIPPSMDGRWLELAVEVRGPEGFTIPKPEEQCAPFASVYVPRGRSMPSGKLRTSEARHAEGRWIVAATVPLISSARAKYLRVYFNRENDVMFPLPLRAHPKEADLGWSKWVASAWDARGEEPPAEKKFGMRWRVQKIEPPPPPPDPEQVEAAKFAALKPDSPLEEWLAHVEDSNHPARVEAALKVVSSRPSELAAAIRSADARVREAALTAVTMMTSFAPEVVEAVLGEGREIAAGVRAFNGMKAADPRFYDVQIELRTRFSRWHRAWWAVHRRTGADGRPPVQEILDLALVRAQGTTMDEIVINARAHLDGIKPPSVQPL